MKDSPNNSKPSAATITAVLALLLSISNFAQLLPLSQANLIITEESSSIIENKDKNIIAISPLIENSGKAEAEEIRFRIFMVPLEKDGLVKKAFDDYLVGNLQPEQKAQFGSFLFKDIVKGERILFIFHLSYQDSLDKKTHDKFYFFVYEAYRDFGSINFNTLISLDYRLVKSKIIDYLTKLTKQESDEPLLNQIRAIKEKDTTQDVKTQSA